MVKIVNRRLINPKCSLFFLFLSVKQQLWLTGKKAKPSYLYAIIGISLVLFLLGTLGWLVINGRALSTCI